MVEGTLTRLLEGLREGRDLVDAEYSAFSDLSRNDLRTVKDHWDAIPVANRAMLFERGLELADVNLELHFEAFAKLGLDDSDPEVRERAVAVLWESDDRDVGQKLAQLTASDPGPGVRAAAAAGLQHFVEAYVLERLPSEAGETIIRALRGALDDPEIEVRAKAIESVGAINEPWVSERVLEAFESDDQRLRLSAIRAMGNSGLERWEEYLESEFTSGDEEMRFEAVIAAGNLGSPLLIEPLGELLSDEDPELVLAVIEALGEIGGDEAIELLQAFAPEAPEGFEEAIENALNAAIDEGMFRSFGDLGSQRNKEQDEDE
ncbi:MAG: HEAT repeat domain-containing protein [bacterium]